MVREVRESCQAAKSDEEFWEEGGFPRELLCHVGLGMAILGSIPDKAISRTKEIIIIKLLPYPFLHPPVHCAVLELCV